MELDEVPARIGENGDGNGARARRLLGEDDAKSFQAPELLFHVFHFECRKRDPLLEDRFLKGPAGGIGIRFQPQLEIIQDLPARRR